MDFQYQKAQRLNHKIFHQVTGIILCIFLIAASNSSFAAILDINLSPDPNPDQWQLLGAKNVVIDSTIWNVSFEDGTCAEVFSGCDQDSYFTFNSRHFARLASQALLDQVLIDILPPQYPSKYDSNPEMISGIENIFWSLIITPYAVGDGNLLPTFDAAVAVNYSSDVSNNDLVVTWEDTLTTFSGDTDKSAVYAKWSLVSIPEPMTSALLAIGLLSLIFTQNKRKATI